MRRYLLCGAIAVGAGTGLLACGKRTAPIDPQLAAVTAYADALIAAHPTVLLRRERPQPTLAGDHPAYLVKFTVERTTWLTSDMRHARDFERQVENEIITDAWQKLFCTTELVQIVRDHQLMVVNGEIVDLLGRGHSLAQCSAGSRAQSISVRDRHIQEP
jgi:hypothetical protein